MSANDSEFVKITTYADMENRERFESSIDPARHRLKTILGEYHFTDWIECGLANCRQKHGHGLLIGTEDGTETNIGHCCGAREFPDQYDVIHKTFKLKRSFSIQGEVIAAYLEKVPGYETRLDGLWNGERSGRWAHKCREAYLQNCPQSIQSRVVSMVGSGGLLYKEIRVEDDDEDALDLGYRRNERIERQSVGVLSGSQALLQSPNSYLKPIKDIMGAYKAVTVNGTIMTGPARRKFTNEVQSIPAKLADAERIIAHARTCFTRENLALLMKIADGKEREGVRQALRAIEQVPTSRMRKAG